MTDAGSRLALRAVDAACVAELCWVSDGRPVAAAVVPLRIDERAAVAMPYAYADELREVARSPWVALALTDPRLTGAAWRPVVLHGSPRLVEDLDGSLFREHLLGQELRKHPPARAYAESELLRRENWWFLPRLVVTIGTDEVTPVQARTMPREDGVLVALAPPGNPRVDSVRVPDWAARPLPLRTAAGDPAAGAGPACVLGHDFSVPDLERWAQHLVRGHLDSGRLHVESAPEAALTLPPPLGLRERIRRHQTLERTCRRGIAAAERAVARE